MMVSVVEVNKSSQLTVWIKMVWEYGVDIVRQKKQYGSTATVTAT